MTVLVDLTNGDVKYNLHDLVAATGTGQAVEFDQFEDRFLHENRDPNNDEGVQGSFFVNTTADVMTLWFKQDNNDDDNSWIQIASASGGGGTALTVTDGTTPTSDVSEIDFEGAYWSLTPTGTTVTIEIDDVITDGTSGLMIGTDKAKLDRLNELTLTGTSLTNTNPTELDFSVTGNQLIIDTETGNLLTWTPTDPSTGDFAEETETFSGLDTAGATMSELTFAGGVDANSVVQKNGVTIQLGDDYEIPDSTTVRILDRSFNDEEVTVLNGGILDSIASDFTFSDSVTIRSNLTVDGNTILGNEDTDSTTINGTLTTSSTSALEGNVTVGTTSDNSNLTVNGDLTVTGTSDLDGDVVGEGFVESVVDLVNEHGGSSSLHLHGTASTTDPVDFVTAPGGNHLLSYLFQAVSGDFNDAINYFTYDDTMVWRFIGEDGPTRNQFSRGNYYATSGYFPTNGGTLTTEVASDEVQSGEWLLFCTGVTQEPSGRLTVSFRVITDGIDVTTDTTNWTNHPSGSSEYVINSANFDRTAASKYNLINVSVSSSCLLYTSPSPRDRQKSRMPSSA